ncbi:MAG: hypothetical protein K2Y17_04795 [Qipengyuania sp.]|nr:hypothetical protein [Qipengyuania sp.]
MKPFRLPVAASLTLALALAACVPQPRSTAPVQTMPAPAPAPVPAPSQAPVSVSWMDAPQTPGDWFYTGAFAGGVAQFGEARSEARFTMRCDTASRSIMLSRAGQPSGAARMTIRTESQTRTLPAAATASALPAVEARLAASDRLLDAMALSKGRFAVEVPGTPTLFLPSWAEVSRAIEDCR